MTQQSLFRSLVLAMAALLACAVSASAQMIPDMDDSRGETDLRDEVRRAVDHDTDVADTALVFNNTTSERVTVMCIAYGADGRFLGRKFAQIPARGLRYLRASDLSGGVDFVGSALCNSRARVAASAVFLAPGAITNLDVLQAGPWDHTQTRFPLVATY